MILDRVADNDFHRLVCLLRSFVCRHLVFQVSLQLCVAAELEFNQ